MWLKIAKKGSGAATLTYAEALEEAIRCGWIDGQKGAHDDSFWLQRFGPRGPRSKWSQVNRRKATELIEQGRMRPAGIAQVEAAKQDGRWEAAYASQSTVAVPDDFQRALDANARRERVLRHAQELGALQLPLPDLRRQTPRDAGTPDRRLRGHAGEGKTIHRRPG